MFFSGKIVFYANPVRGFEEGSQKPGPVRVAGSSNEKCPQSDLRLRTRRLRNHRRLF